MSNDPPRMTGLFAGILSSANGTWIPMPELRRMSSVAAWMLFVGLLTYAIVRLAPKSGMSELSMLGLFLCLLIMIAIAVGSFWLFMAIGCAQFGFEKTSDKKDYEKFMT